MSSKIPPKDPPSQSIRTIRKIQSHQTLPTTSNARGSSLQHSPRVSGGAEDLSKLTQVAPTPRIRPHRRARSNSDAASHDPNVSTTQKRPARKTGSGFGVKRSVLENLLRDGPQNGNILEGLQELRYLVLSTRVDADADGMVCLPSFYSELLLTAETSRPTESTSGSLSSISPPSQQTTTSPSSTAVVLQPTPRSATTPSAP